MVISLFGNDRQTSPPEAGGQIHLAVSQGNASQLRQQR